MSRCGELSQLTLIFGLIFFACTTLAEFELLGNGAEHPVEEVLARMDLSELHRVEELCAFFDMFFLQEKDSCVP